MENLAYNEWLDAREERHALLFGPENSLASLALRTPTGGDYTFAARVGREEIKASVDSILRYHQDLARSDEGGALFAVTDEENLDVLSDITSNVIVCWERVAHRTNTPSPFEDIPIKDIERDDFETQGVQLVVETAAAVLSVIHAGYPFGRSKESNGRVRDSLVRIIAKRGSDYAQAWMRGDQIKQYCEEHGRDPNEWLRLLSSAERASILMMAPSSPIKHLGRVIKKFESIHPKVISDETGWNQDRAEDLFPPHRRLRIATAYADPVAMVRQFAQLFDNKFSLQAVAEHLGLTEVQSDSLFPPSKRMHAIIYNVDPMAVFAKKTELYRDLATTYGLSPGLNRRLISMSRDRAHHVAGKIVDARLDSPPHVSQGVWDWAIATYPDDTTDSRRLKLVAEYNLFLSVNSPSLYESFKQKEVALSDKSAGDPANILTESLPGDYLLDLAEKAGVDHEDLGVLIARFAQQQELDNEQQTLLNRLRRAANQHDKSSTPR